MDIKKLGVWAGTDELTATEAARFAQQLEEWGYGALWFPEAVGRESFSHASWLLSQTKSLVIATGIANIWARDAQAAAAGRHTLDEQSGGRFILGLGVSHVPLVNKVRGHEYEKPLAKMKDYLEGIKQALFLAPKPEKSGELILAALAPLMLKLSGEQADGAHPYNTNPEHTKRARAAIGPNKKLYVEQLVILETDEAKMREVATKFFKVYQRLPNYRNAWIGMGFTENDIDTYSPEFINSIVAWGDEARIRARLEEHWAAGADHVCIQAVNGPEARIDQNALKVFAPG